MYLSLCFPLPLHWFICLLFQSSLHVFLYFFPDSLCYSGLSFILVFALGLPLFCCLPVVSNTIVSQPTCAVRQRHTGSQKCITCLVNSYISFSGLRKLKAKPTILCTMQASLTTTCKHAYMLHPRSFFFFPLTMHTGHLLACI